MTHESYQSQTTKSENSMRLSISRGLLEGHPSPGMWALSPTPNLLSKCHQVLTKDKGKGHCESLCIHLPLSVPWIGYSGLIRPVYLLPCRNGQTKKRRRRGIISFYTMREGLRQSSKGADVYTHMQAITVEGLMPRVKKKERRTKIAKGWERGGLFVWPNGFCLLHFVTSQRVLKQPLFVAWGCNIRC